MQVIRTKWHKLPALVDANEVYLTAPPEADGTADHWDKYDPKPNSLRALLRHGDGLPKFTIDQELARMAYIGDQTDAYYWSILDMQKAGVMRLPYPAMLIEIPGEIAHSIILLRDLSYKDQFPWEGPNCVQQPVYGEDTLPMPFYSYVMRINHDTDGDYLVISPSMQYLGLHEKDGVPTLALSSAPVDIFSNAEKIDELTRKTYKKDAGEGWCALFSALLIMNTAGVEKEVIEVARLNRRRVLSNKPPIPQHTYIRIGHVYRSASGTEKDEYIPRKSPRPHWRRGHLRHVRHGAGREKLKQVYINPRLVSVHNVLAEDPKPPQYMVKQ